MLRILSANPVTGPVVVRPAAGGSRLHLSPQKPDSHPTSTLAYFIWKLFGVRCTLHGSDPIARHTGYHVPPLSGSGLTHGLAVGRL